MTFTTILIIFWAIMIPVAIYRYFFVGLPAWTQPSRASQENKLLASWKYTGEEWACYANSFFFKNLKDESLKNSRKEVKIDITSRYIVLTTGAISNRIVIDGKCVRAVDCTISDNVLTIVRGVRFPNRFGSRRDTFQKTVFQLPIPRGDGTQAAHAVEYFGILIQEEAENIADLYAASRMVSITIRFFDFEKDIHSRGKIVKIKLLVMTTALIFAGLNTGAAQTKDVLHTPRTGSAERQAIFDGLRRGDAEQVKFKVDYLKVHDGWAWIDATPLDKRGRAIAEGGASLLYLEGNIWKAIDLSIVPEDPDDPMGADDLSKVFLANIRKTFPAAPLDIFPKPGF